MSPRFKSQIIVVMRLLAIGLCFVLLLHDGPPHRRSLEALNHTIARPFHAGETAEAEETEEGESEEFEDIDGRGDWFTYQRNYPFNGIPADARRRAWEA